MLRSSDMLHFVEEYAASSGYQQGFDQIWKTRNEYRPRDENGIQRMGLGQLAYEYLRRQGETNYVPLWGAESGSCIPGMHYLRSHFAHIRIEADT